jgi:uncharacterized protein involved in oxidation of intracellular sulfur
MSERATQVLIIVNDGPYGSERSYNALRLAMNLIVRPQAAVHLFLIGEGVTCAHKGQRTPDGYYSIERMIRSVARLGEAAA